jgi:hypothetical protein
MAASPPIMMPMMTQPTSRQTSPVCHGFSGSWLVLSAVTNDIRRGYITPRGVTRKFLLLNRPLPIQRMSFMVAR